MKLEATKEDYENRDKFLIKYINSQILKMNLHREKYNCEKSAGKRSAYQGILFKLTK